MYGETTRGSAAHALHIVILTVPRVGRSDELFPNGGQPRPVTRENFKRNVWVRATSVSRYI